MNDPVKNCKWALYPLGDITQWYGENPLLYTKAFKDAYPEYYEKTKKFVHSGIDIVRPHGEHLFAVEDGIITKVVDDATGYGKHIKLETNHKTYKLEWVYGHLDRIFVEKGQAVKAGQFIATMGNTGFVVSNSTGNGYWNANPYAGTHLHLGVRKRVNGKVQDYYNGAFGRFDFLPLFFSPIALKVFYLAQTLKTRVYFQLAELLLALEI